MLIRCSVPAVGQLHIPARCNMYCARQSVNVQQSSCFAAYLVFSCVIVQLRMYRPPNVWQIPLQHPVCGRPLSSTCSCTHFVVNSVPNVHAVPAQPANSVQSAPFILRGDDLRNVVCTVQTWRSCVLCVPPIPPFFI